MQKDLKVGDEAWYVPGYSGDALIAVKVRITELDDQYRKRSPNGYLFYEVDEIVGHSLAREDLLSREKAERVVRDRYVEELAYIRSFILKCPNDKDLRYLFEEVKTYRPSLQKFRHLTHKFIRKTWKEAGEVHPGFDPLPEKKEGIDWFGPPTFDEVKDEVEIRLQEIISTD